MKMWFSGSWVLILGFAEGRATPRVHSHTAYTRPLPLLQGEVTNTFHDLTIPKGPIAIYRFAADVVEKDEHGDYVPVPLYDAYLHHHVVGSNHHHHDANRHRHAHDPHWSPMKPPNLSRAIGFGAGTESRGTPQSFHYPYAFLTEPGEDSWIANVHIINTRRMPRDRASHCVECPCTPQNSFLKQPGKSDSTYWGKCNLELTYGNNTSCFPETYLGGLRCCEDGAYCLEPPELDGNSTQSTYMLRYIIEYAPVVPENQALSLAGCCDVSGNMTTRGAVEYDVPKCNKHFHPGCVHTLSTVQMLNAGLPSSFLGAFAEESTEQDPNREVELLYAVGHQHRGGLGVNLYDEETGNLICGSVPTYGTGMEVGNEEHYVVAMSTCTFSPPLRVKANAPLRMVAMYNNTVAHTGVMSLFYLATAEIPTTPHRSTYHPFYFFVALVGSAIIIVAVKKYRSRRGYQQVSIY